MRRVSARIAGDTTCHALEEEARRLRRRTRLLERVVERLQRAEVWDFSAYEQTPGPEWVAVHRQDLEALYAAASDAGRWRPWQSIVERRAF